MRDISLLILACQQLLDIQTPVQVEYKTRFRGGMKNTAAYCWETRRKGKLKKFRLVINARVMVESEYDSFMVIAHEFVHARMIEDNTFDPNNHHCPRFQKIAAELQKQLQKSGFPITRALYDPAIDVT